MYRKLFTIFIVSVCVQGLSACGSMPLKGHQTKITSAPSGALVYSGQLKLGKTPLTIKPDEAFPPAWSGRAYQASGVLIVKMEGCEEYSKRVSDGFLSKDIHVKLKCSPALKKKKTKIIKHPAPKVTGKPVKAAKPAAKGKSIEQRLQELERLYKKRLISRDEYQAIRKRILGEI